jgi:hypothetical protein
MTYDDRDRDMRDETVPAEGDVRDDLDMRRPTDLDDEVEHVDDRDQKTERGEAAGAKLEDEAQEDDDVAKRDVQTTNR